jgi:hypothetical protein
MFIPGKVKPSVHCGCSGKHNRYTAYAPCSYTIRAPDYYPTCPGGERSDPQCGAYRIDGEQCQDNSEASKARACEIGRVKPTAAEWQPSQQQRYADATFDKGYYEGKHCRRQNDR